MSTVFVIGLGNMGAALAQTLLGAGHQLTVWNRTSEKAKPLVEAGAAQAENVASGIAANEYIVICVGDYTQSMEVLRDHGALLSTKTVIQLTSSTSAEAVTMSKWATEQGALYLDGAIWNYPSQVGTDEGRVAVAGSAEAWKSGEHLVMSMGGRSGYYGTNVTAPTEIDRAAVLYAAFTQLGAIQAAYLLERAGLDVGKYIDRLLEELPFNEAPARRQLEAVASNDFSDTEASLGAWTDFLSKITGEVDKTKPEGALLGGMATLLERAVDLGYGEEELASVVKVLRGS